MDLSLPMELTSDYKSRSQIARILTEAWFHENGYCPACPSGELDRLKANTKVMDFRCPECGETYQLKSKSGKFYNRIANSEYHTKIKKIKKGLSPNWAFLQYDAEEYRVVNLMIVPRHFMTLDAVEARKPLSPNARRAGWVGSNILLNRFPPDARLYVVREGMVTPSEEVRKQWKNFEFLRDQRLENKGWLNDVLGCVRELDKKEFTLQEMYQYTPRLSDLHPKNRHVEAKIRQQLQVLRDNGVLVFVSRGKYRLNI